MKSITVGVLALQGAFAKHIEVLESLGVKAIEVRIPSDLNHCDGLIIPGGESTAMMRQLNFIKMTKALEEFAQSKPIFGTCAGLILISKDIVGDPMQPLGLIDVTIERNAFGRQADSFKSEIELHKNLKQHRTAPAFFIRAPRIRKVDSTVVVLGTWRGEPVLVQQGHYLGATFHPELTDDTTIHQYFLSLIKLKGNSP